MARLLLVVVMVVDDAAAAAVTMEGDHPGQHVKATLQCHSAALECNTARLL